MRPKMYCIRWDGSPVTQGIIEVLYDIAQDIYKYKIPYVEFHFGLYKGEVFTEEKIIEVGDMIGYVFYSTICVGENKTTIEFVVEEYVEEKYGLEFLVSQGLIETKFGLICRN